MGRPAISSDGDQAGDALFRPSERFSLDERSPVPLYHQVEQIILDRIAKAGEIGGRVPREMDLIQIFDVSRATVKLSLIHISEPTRPY